MSTEAFLFPMDYTSRDYLALREDLIGVIKSRVPEWDPNDPSDFGIALVEAFSYMGDVINYYIDRAAAETFLGTASQRKSLLNLASLLGYVPAGRTAATVPVTFTNTAAENVYIKPGTQISTTIRTGDANIPLTFEVNWNPAFTDGRWPVNASGATAVVACTEGITAKRNVLGVMTPGKVIGTGDGFPGQTYYIRDYPVINRSVGVTVNAVSYTYVQNLYDATPTDRVFTYRTDDQGVTAVIFGDGVSGVIPAIGAEIIATYRLGGGTVGNIGRGQTFNIIDSVYKASNDASTAYIGAITNQTQATGGADEESNEHIRQSAFTTFRTRNSAVTKQDFQDIALSDNRLSKAKARGNSFANILVYVAPVSSGSRKSDPAPGYDAYAVVTKAKAGTTATLTLAETPQYAAGTYAVTISGMGTPFDGAYTATYSGTGNNITYTTTTGTVAAAPAAGVVSFGELADFAVTRSDVQTNLVSKGVVGTIVNVYPPQYRDIKITVDFAAKTQYRQSVATAAVKTALLNWISYNNINFNETIRPQEILAEILNTVEEVQYANVTLDDITLGTTAQPYVVATSAEILRLLDGNVVLNYVTGSGIDGV